MNKRDISTKVPRKIERARHKLDQVDDDPEIDTFRQRIFEWFISQDQDRDVEIDLVCLEVVGTTQDELSLFVAVVARIVAEEMNACPLDAVRDDGAVVSK